MLLRTKDRFLITFGSLDDAAAWLTDNPDALPDP